MVSFICVEMILTLEEESDLLVVPWVGDYGAPLEDDVQQGDVAVLSVADAASHYKAREVLRNQVIGTGEVKVGFK
jgi:hypothetical protein